jgi:hypothetical protein
VTNRFNRVPANFKDLLQHVWCKLIGADILGKYLRNVTPKEVTAVEAAAYFGISFQQFRAEVRRGMEGSIVWDATHTCCYHLPPRTGRPRPRPLRGSPDETSAVYRFADVEAMRATYKPRKLYSTPCCPAAMVNISHFRNYLQRAIHNHWANWCRTYVRRYRELLLPPLVDGTPWEEALWDNRTDEDAMDHLDTPPPGVRGCYPAMQGIEAYT